MIVVISTGWAPPTKPRCIESVACQKGVEFEHVVIDASEQTPLKIMTENLYETIHGLPKENIVVSLDLDDWLPHDLVLAKIQHMHDAGAWITYGNFVFSDGRPSFVNSDYLPMENPRTSPWRATHLKSFRAGLFQRIKQDDLKYKGEWRDRGQDVAFMLPMLEMAGREHRMFCPETLCVYNYQSSFEMSASPSELAREAAMVLDARNRPQYDKIEAL